MLSARAATAKAVTHQRRLGEQSAGKAAKETSDTQARQPLRAEAATVVAVEAVLLPVRGKSKAAHGTTMQAQEVQAVQVAQAARAATASS